MSSPGSILEHIEKPQWVDVVDWPAVAVAAAAAFVVAALAVVSLYLACADPLNYTGPTDAVFERAEKAD